VTPQAFAKLCEESICPACGFQLDFKPWSGEYASLEICPSCGIQFGYDDCAGGESSDQLRVYLDWRQRWVDSGMKWWSQSGKPTDWNPKSQIERLANSVGSSGRVGRAIVVDVRQIGLLLASHLEKLCHDSTGWYTLFRDSRDGQLWELSYPESALHGGGPPQLAMVSVEEARCRYGEMPS
jgi:Immunity protein 27